MGFTLASFIRMFKMLSFSVCCSFALLVLQMMFNQNFTFLHVVSLVVFLGCIAYDSYQFSSLYGTIKDSFFGLVLPLIGSFLFVAVGYFFFPENLFNYLFLPLRAFEALSFMRYHSLLLSGLCWVIVVFSMSWAGSMHPIEMDDDYFDTTA